MQKKIIPLAAVLAVILSAYFIINFNHNPKAPVTGQFDQKYSKLHVGIIMDGNRRWAQLQGQGTAFGHKEGAKTAEQIIKYANDIGLGQLTLYALSIENLKRSKPEVDALFSLVAQALENWPEKLGKKNIKIRFFGDRTLYPEGLRAAIESLEDKTSTNSGLALNVLFCYGGDAEILNSVKEIALKVANKELDLKNIDKELFNQSCWTGSIGSPDLIIRTGKQKRMSNFMPLGSVYSEIAFIDDLWPNFKTKDLDRCLDDLLSRKRSFGV